MNIVFEREFSRPGNDCMIEEMFGIVEMFNKYLAIHVTHYSGWMGDDYDKRSEFFDSESKAKKFLKECGLDYAEQHHGR